MLLEDLLSWKGLTMIIYLIAVALFFGFMYLCYKHSETERLETETAQNILKDKYSVKLEYLYNRLEFNNQKNIILKEDFIVAPHYYKVIKPGTYATESILQLANEIFSYLNICPVDVTVVYDWDDRYTSHEHRAGYYRNVGPESYPDIHILVKQDYSCKDIAAVLCHEITHYYMYLQNIHMADVEENEEYTDITAILLGFGNVLMAGYKETTKEITRYNKIIHYTSKLGYLTLQDCSIVYGLVNELKHRILIKKESELELEQLRKQATCESQLAYQLYNQMSDYIKNGFDKMPSAEDFTKIQNLYAKIENGYFISQLHELKQIENNDATISELNSLLAKANKICTEIAEYNSIIGKY